MIKFFKVLRLFFKDFYFLWKQTENKYRLEEIYKRNHESSSIEFKHNIENVKNWSV